jgi:DNA-binding Lrp family transcriptional regulator
MKLLRVLDGPETALASDRLNQVILRELVTSEYSVTELARRLNVSTLKLWRRMQKLVAADLIELSATKKSGNIEKKLYRATAANYVSAQLLDYKPKDPRLSEAFEVYSNIQQSMRALLSGTYEIPKEADPIDFAIYANMRAFAQVCGRRDVQERISQLDKKLADYKPV